MSRKQKIKEQLEKGATSRLQLERLRLKLPKVNRELAKKLMATRGVKAEKKADARVQQRLKEAADRGEDITDAAISSQHEQDAKDQAVREALSLQNLVDPRFEAMFTKPEFEVDPTAEEYQGWQRGGKSLRRAVDERWEDLNELLEGADASDSGEEGHGSDDEEEEAALVQDLLGVTHRRNKDDDDDEDNEDDDVGDDADAQKRRGGKRGKQERVDSRKRAKEGQKRGGPRLQRDHDDVDITPMQTAAMGEARRKAKNTTFSKLLASSAEEDAGAEGEGHKAVRRVAGGKVAQLVVRTKGGKGSKGSKGGEVEKSAAERREEEKMRRENKRGIGSLRLARPSTAVYWRGRKIRD